MNWKMKSKSMSKIVYISDFFFSEIRGGCEINDEELVQLLDNKGYTVVKCKTVDVSLDFLTENINNFFIISNFIGLKSPHKDFITHKCSYMLYEHDHKYVTSRNPAVYPNFKAPLEDLINVEFYENAKKIFCQSSFHEKIIKSNLGLSNLWNVSGNLWSLESLEILEQLCDKQKKDAFSVLDSRTLHKNTFDAVRYCEAKKQQYELVSSPNYYTFLEMLGNNNKLIFFPQTPETLSRIVVEARMMNMKVLINKNVGASYEPWFKTKGKDLITIMKNKRDEVCNKVIEVMNE